MQSRRTTLFGIGLTSATCAAKVHYQLIDMTDDKPQFAETHENREVRQDVRSVETWAPASNLPPNIANEIIRERQLEVTPSLVWEKGYPEDAIRARVLSAQDRVAAMNAQSPTEAMLAIQLVNTHEAYTACHRRAMLAIDNPMAFAAHIKNAEKLSNLYLRQLAALDKHRGHGMQQVRVEHVTVAAGGQAIVGKIDVNPRPEPLARSEQEMS
jgi:hypothetical protein